MNTDAKTPVCIVWMSIALATFTLYAADGSVDDAAKGNPPAARVPRLPRDDLLVYRGDDNKPSPVRTIDDWLRRRREIVDGMQAVMGRLPGDEKRSPLDMKIEEEVDGGTYCAV